MNLGLVHSLDTDLPVYYKLFPGSIRDTAALKNLADDLAELGVSNLHILLDPSFFSEASLSMLSEMHLDFTVSVPMGCTAAKELLLRSHEKIRAPARTHSFQGEAVFVYESNLSINRKSFRAVVYSDYAREVKERSALYARITEAEEYLNGREYDADFVAEFRENHKLLAELLSLREADGRIVTKRKEANIHNAESKLGRTILLTTSEESWDKVLAWYRQRNDAEAHFRTVKSSVEGENLSSNESLEEQMDIDFIALSLRTVLLNRMKKQTLLKNCCVPDIINEMSKLKVVRIGEDWRLNELTKKQKDYFKALSITPPIDNY